MSLFENISFYNENRWAPHITKDEYINKKQSEETDRKRKEFQRDMNRYGGKDGIHVGDTSKNRYSEKDHIRSINSGIDEINDREERKYVNPNNRNLDNDFLEQRKRRDAINRHKRRHKLECGLFESVEFI